MARPAFVDSILRLIASFGAGLLTDRGENDSLGHYLTNLLALLTCRSVWLLGSMAPLAPQVRARERYTASQTCRCSQCLVDSGWRVPKHPHTTHTHTHTHPTQEAQQSIFSINQELNCDWVGSSAKWPPTELKDGGPGPAAALVTTVAPRQLSCPNLFRPSLVLEKLDVVGTSLPVPLFLCAPFPQLHCALDVTEPCLAHPCPRPQRSRALCEKESKLTPGLGAMLCGAV